MTTVLTWETTARRTRVLSFDDAVSLLAAAPVAVIGIGFTSSSYVTGADAERDLVERLQSRSSGRHVVATCAAAVDALRRLGADRIAVVDPPWFDEELDRLGAEYFSSQGFDVVFHAPRGLPSNQRSINPPELYDWVLAHTPASAQAEFVGGNGFRSVGVIAALEEELERPVVTANQVLLWGMLRAVRSRVAPRGYGRLLTLTP